MGLDITFNLRKAQKAGLVMTTNRRFTEAEIEEAKSFLKEPLTGQDLEYLEWMKGEETVGQLDDCVYPFVIDVWTTGGGIEMGTVRANEWGNLHKPLTEFLGNADIPYTST